MEPLDEGLGHVAAADETYLLAAEHCSLPSMPWMAQRTVPAGKAGCGVT
jgi:hypothetical protein